MICVKKRISAIFAIFFYLVFSPVTSFNAILPINPIQQELSFTCWAAVCEMVIEYWYKQITQEEIVIWAADGANEVNWLTGTSKSCDKIVFYLPESSPGFLQTLWTNSYLDKNLVADETNKYYRPIFAGLEDLDNTNPGRHIVLIVGCYPTTNNIVYNDPDIDPQKFGQHTEYYHYFKKGVERKWIQSLQIITNHSNPGPFDGVTPPDGPDQLSYPGMESTYNSRFVQAPGSEATVTLWQWDMEFHYFDGIYNIPGDFSSLPLSSSCHFPAFILPTGYKWKYTSDGNIYGYVKVNVLDSDGYYHDNFKYIEYTPQDKFPSILWYAYKTISTSQPEVKAHYTIDLYGDQLLPGCSITFSAGTTINIIDNVTIENGSIVNFNVEPNLQY